MQVFSCVFFRIFLINFWIVIEKNIIKTADRAINSERSEPIVYERHTNHN